MTPKTGTTNNTRRTTVLLREEDQRNLQQISEMKGGISDVEAIRWSLAVGRELLAWAKKEEGEVILKKGTKRVRIHLF